jgi:hypothetical protein
MGGSWVDGSQQAQIALLNDFLMDNGEWIMDKAIKLETGFQYSMSNCYSDIRVFDNQLKAARYPQPRYH